jgi:hypothetical protein
MSWTAYARKCALAAKQRYAKVPAVRAAVREFKAASTSPMAARKDEALFHKDKQG